MIKVVESITFYNSRIPKVDSITSEKGKWNVGKVHKVGIMGAGRTYEYSVEFENEDEYNDKFETLNEDFVKGLKQLGFESEEEISKLKIKVEKFVK